MSAFRPRSLLKVARNVNQAVRNYSSQSSGGGNAYRLPALFGSAVLAGSAFAAIKSEYGVQGFLPSVHASPPKPVAAAPMERTFIMIKPDGVKRGLIADIIKRFEQRGYKLVAMKMLQADDALLNEHYADLKPRPFFPGLIRHISSGPVVAWYGRERMSLNREDKCLGRQIH